MTTVLLATCARLPGSEQGRGTDHLVPALRRRGLDARWVVWDDPAVDWSGGLVALRSTWDYEERLPEFLHWARSLPWLLNSADVFTWNTDKGYLVELAAAGVPVVPTVAVDDPSGLPGALARSGGGGVVKPRVGAGGRGVVVVEPGAGLDDPGRGPWVVQPLVGSVRTEGETSVFVLGGQPFGQARKVPAAGEIRVHEEYGGTTVAVEPTEEATRLALGAVAVAERLVGGRLDYARVDQVRLEDGTLAVSELELTEPSLYLDVLPGNAEAFADLVEQAVDARGVGRRDT